MSYFREYGLDMRIQRPFNVYGLGSEKTVLMAG